MTKTKIEHQLLRDFRKLSPEGRGEVLEYLRWMRDVENKERLRGFKNNDPKERLNMSRTGITEPVLEEVMNKGIANHNVRIHSASV